jgi:hypothetical protein
MILDLDCAVVSVRLRHDVPSVLNSVWHVIEAPVELLRIVLDTVAGGHTDDLSVSVARIEVERRKESRIRSSNAHILVQFLQHQLTSLQPRIIAHSPLDAMSLYVHNQACYLNKKLVKLKSPLSHLQEH